MSLKGFEPPTHGLEGRCSIQLSYRLTVIIITKAGDGNRTHVSSLEGWCSTIELHPHNKILFTPNGIDIGVTGFEPATSWSQTRRSSQAEPHPGSLKTFCSCCFCVLCFVFCVHQQREYHYIIAFYICQLYFQNFFKTFFTSFFQVPVPCFWAFPKVRRGAFSQLPLHSFFRISEKNLALQLF